MVRNFYIRGNIDGRKTDLSGGSSRKDGGMNLLITQRNEGCIEKCAEISCWKSDGILHTVIKDKNGNAVLENITKR